MRMTRIKKVGQEYRVRLYIDGNAVPEQDYFTDDIVDAEITASLMLRGDK
jgi:hypothetical protein